MTLPDSESIFKAAFLMYLPSGLVLAGEAGAGFKLEEDECEVIFCWVEATGGLSKQANVDKSNFPTIISFKPVGIVHALK